MRIERYYSSVREELSVLSSDALALLNRQDYVGFFKACGPNYIRGIRRAQEVVAFLEFESSSETRASSYASSVQLRSGWWNRRASGSYASSSTFNQEESGLTINIKGWGLGLSQDGSEVLVATSLAEFNGVMRFAFRTMTTIPDAVHVGMVYGMEVLPWVHNTMFQVQAAVNDEAIEIPLPRSLIPKAFLIADSTNFSFDNSARSLSRCKNPSFDIDMFGYCCEDGALYDNTNQEYDSDNPENRICKPVRQLDPSMIKDNMAANGEFVARLDRAVRYKLVQMSTLERCISAVQGIPDRYNYNILKTQDNVKYDEALELSFSVFELKMALDPFNDFSFVKHMGKELDEFLDMYIAPCMAAIFGSNIGNTPGTDNTYFMAYAWHQHDECTKLSCLGTSMRWNRDNPDGGCTTSLIAGSASENFDGDASKCSVDETGAGCKHDAQQMRDYYTTMTTCWDAVVPTGRVDYFMDNFCLPKVTIDVLDPTSINHLRQQYIESCSPDSAEQFINVAMNKPSDSSSSSPDSQPGYANDGNIDGYFWRKSTSKTTTSTEPWWHVFLEDMFVINQIVVYNRQDAARNDLNNFRVTIFDEDDNEVWQYNDRGSADYRTSITVPDMIGDKVEVKLMGRDRTLSLAEVEVYGAVAP
jgi:hypothetical protein